MSHKFAFGTYRTTIQNPIHIQSLDFALNNGITHIDTSSNYMYGEAEMLIGHVLQNKKREDFTIVSKGGYLQGPNLQRVQEGWMVEDLVKYDANCYHSISPMFLEDQIDNSLKRLNTDYIDTYLLHNPEYYLMHELKKDATDQDLDTHHQIMQNRIKMAFECLEEQVKKGKIKSYGISSNSFAKQDNDYHFLEYKSLVEYAKSIAGETHHLKVLQLPMNMYEKDGVPCAKWAKEQGLEVHVNRPLNAFYMGGMLRLASYDECAQFEELLTEVQKIPNEHFQELINKLLEYQNKFAFAGDVDDTIEYEIIPYIVKHMKIDEQYYELIDSFLNCYKSNIKAALSKLIAKELKFPEPIDKEALNYLQEKYYIDKILVGMRQQKYVEKILSYIH